jgi:hypothetical protein
VLQRQVDDPCQFVRRRCQGRLNPQPAQSHIRGRLQGVCATIEAPSRDTHGQRSG